MKMVYYVVNGKNQRIFIKKNQIRLFKNLGYRVFVLKMF